MGSSHTASALGIHPLTAERWPDLERLFGERGASSGCWCMWWRLSRAEWQQHAGEGNRRAFRQVVEQGPPPGLLAYHGDEPAGWCAVAPRASYPTLNRSPILRPVDGEPVWSITCLYIDRRVRRRGISEALVRAAVAFAGEQGARLVEAYPLESHQATTSAAAFTGVASVFERAGFRTVARRGKTSRPIMRREVVTARG